MSSPGGIKVGLAAIAAVLAVGWAAYMWLGQHRTRIAYREGPGPGDQPAFPSSGSKARPSGTGAGTPNEFTRDVAVPAPGKTQPAQGESTQSGGTAPPPAAPETTRVIQWPPADSPEQVGSMMDALEQAIAEKARPLVGTMQSAESLAKAARLSIEPFVLDDPQKQADARRAMGEPDPEPARAAARPPILGLAKGASVDTDGLTVKASTLGEGMGMGGMGGGKRVAKGGPGAGPEDRFGARIKVMRAPAPGAPVPDPKQRVIVVAVPMRTPQAKDNQADLQVMFRFAADGNGGWRAVDDEVGVADPALLRRVMPGRK